MSADALEAVDRIVSQGGEPDDVLRSIVAVLAVQPGVTWAGVAFMEQDRLVLGPEAGEPDEAERVRVPVLFQGREVGELRADGEIGRELLERVAALVSAHVLIGWDTAGLPWEP